jgi:hypothetical protein
MKRIFSFEREMRIFFAIAYLLLLISSIGTVAASVILFLICRWDKATSLGFGIFGLIIAVIVLSCLKNVLVLFAYVEMDQTGISMKFPLKKMNQSLLWTEIGQIQKVKLSINSSTYSHYPFDFIMVSSERTDFPQGEIHYYQKYAKMKKVICVRLMNNLYEEMVENLSK